MNVAQLNILLKSRLDLSPKVLQDLQNLQRKCNLIGDTIVRRFLAYTDEYGTEDALMARKQNSFTILSGNRSSTSIPLL